MSRLSFLLVTVVAGLLLGPARAEDRRISVESKAGARRVALVIGNSRYNHAGELTNTRRDAEAMGQLFGKAGFKSIVKVDLGVIAFRRALADFEVLARDADVAVVYYAGHGIEFNSQNFLVPVDATIARAVDVKDETVPLERILEAVAGARRLKLVILDACRSDPFKALSRTRSANRGLSRVDPTDANELVAYSAKAGTVAQDGDPGSNSPFTQALLTHLAVPGKDIRLALGSVRDEVFDTTHHEQEPFTYGSIGGDEIALVPGAPAVAAAASSQTAAALPAPPAVVPSVPESASAAPSTAAAASEPVPAAPVAGSPADTGGPADAAVWSLIENSSDVALVESFIARFPTSALVAKAQARLSALGAAAPSPSVPAPAALEADRPADEIAWTFIENSADAALVESFIARFPTSAQRAKAEARLVALRSTGNAAVDAAPDALVAACDRLAGSPLDPARSPDAAGVRAGRIDVSLAVPACRRALDAHPDDGRLAFQLGRALSQTGSPQDDAEAIELYRRAAKAGSAPGMVNLGTIYGKGLGVPRDETQAFVWFRKAARAGSVLGMYNVGLMYRSGSGVPADDVEAISWFQKAVAADFAPAMKEVGDMYRFGRGVAKDEAVAVRWYRAAAERRVADAMAALGVMYIRGCGVARDPAQAAYWFMKAADAGNAAAMRDLGLMYENGDGVPHDLGTATKWFGKATAAGDRRARRHFEVLTLMGYSP